MEGISRREAARRAGVDESTVRRALDSRALNKALLPDDSLEPILVLKLLAENVQSGRNTPAALTSAKTRRLRAQVAKLDDELLSLRTSTIAVDDVETLLSEQRGILARQLAGVPWDVGNAAAGKPADEAHRIIKRIVSDALARSVEDDAENLEPETERGVDLDTLSPNLLTARRISLQAEKLEIESALARGEARTADHVISDLEGRLGIVKSLLLAMPGRLAQAAEDSTPEEFETSVEAELEKALAEL